MADQLNCAREGCPALLEYGGSSGMPAKQSKQQMLEMMAGTIGWQRTFGGKWLCKDHRNV